MQAGLLRSTPRTTWLDLCAWSHLVLLRARAVRRSDERVLAVGLVMIVLFRAGGESNAKTETHLLALHQVINTTRTSHVLFLGQLTIDIRVYLVELVSTALTKCRHKLTKADAVASLPPLPYAAMHVLFLSSTARHPCQSATLSASWSSSTSTTPSAFWPSSSPLSTCTT